MTLRHVKREEIATTGTQSWKLTGPDGQRISVFDEFCRSIKDEAYATKRRYAIVASRFIDYLHEVEVLGKEPVTKRVVNKAIDYYIQLLRYGNSISLGIVQGSSKVYEDGDKEKEDALREVARRLQIKPLAPHSWGNTIAALNQFLQVCQALEAEAHEIAIVQGGLDRALVEESKFDYMPLLDAVAGCRNLSRAEAQHIRQSSILGGVIRYRARELRRPRGLSAGHYGDTPQELQDLDFPMKHFPALLEATTHWRDRTLWTLLAASGIRRSEALNLEWGHIDIENELVYVLDPNATRYSRDLPENERANRFKGRAASWTYLRHPYRTNFFEMLRKYRCHEYMLPADGNNFVFQYLNKPHRGRPLREASDSSLNSLFTGAVKRARIPPPSMKPNHVWTAHSLRHAYCTYMLNDFEVPGHLYPGLTEAEVQLLVGHTSILSTRHYARRRQDRLREKLEMHDRKEMHVETLLEELPHPIGERFSS